jgi:hypothetical protein
MIFISCLRLKDDFIFYIVSIVTFVIKNES